MVWLIDLCPDALIDPLMRLPIALLLDHLIGPVWKSLQETGNIDETTAIGFAGGAITFTSTLQYYAHSKTLVAAATFMCWMTLKFLPRTQLLLFGVLAEGFALAALIAYLIILSASATWSVTVGILVATNILHAEMISDFRHLRFFELMGCPRMADVVGSRSSFIANTPWLCAWPNLPLLAVLYRGMATLGYAEVLPGFGKAFTASAVLLALPVLFFLLDGVRWRMYGLKASLTGRDRERGGMRVTVIGSYYACVTSLVWPSIGEDKVNKVYAMVWGTRMVYQITQSLMSAYSGPSETLVGLPRLLVDATLSSYVTMFGFCWIVAHLYHEVYSKWLFSMDVLFNPQQLHSHEMQKYDFSGHLFVFFHQANIATTSSKTHEPLARLLLFLFLFRLSRIPDYVQVYSQTLFLEGTGHTKFYLKFFHLKAVLEGAVAPLLLGMTLFARVWQAPYALTTVIPQIWDRNLTLPFPSEFEMWLHSEALLAVGDLLVALTVAVFCTVAYPSQVVPAGGDSSHFWHRYLARVDFGSKIWLQVVRELAGIFVHLVIMSFMFEQLWRALTSPTVSGVMGCDVMGWSDLMNFVVYFGRYADGNVRFSYTTQNGIISDVVCSYRCVIRELPPPDVQAFKEWKDVCAICQAEEENRLNLCVFPCVHYFHRECIEPWLKTRMSCPMCMRTVWLENGVVKMDNLDRSTVPVAMQAEEEEAF